MHERETSFPLKLPPLLVERAVAGALDEDLSLAGDITTDSIIPAEAEGEAAIVLRKPGVVAGLDLVIACTDFNQMTKPDQANPRLQFVLERS